MIRTPAPIIAQSSLPKFLTILQRTQQRNTITMTAITNDGMDWASRRLEDILEGDGAIRMTGAYYLVHLFLLLCHPAAFCGTVNALGHSGEAAQNQCFDMQRSRDREAMDGVSV